MTTPTAEPEPTRPSWWVPVLAVLLAVTLLAGWSIQHEFHMQRAQAAARLAWIGELRTTQVGAWVQRQMSLADFLSGGRNLAGLLDRAFDEGDATALPSLMARAEAFRRANEADAALVVDAQGRELASESGLLDTVPPPELAAAVRRAIAEGAPTNTGIYRGTAAMPVRFDVVVPLRRPGASPRGAIVIRLDPQRTLFPLLTSWPATATGESVLWRRDGERIVNVSDTRFRDQPPGQLQQSAENASLAAARWLRGQGVPGEAVVAIDYRGVEVLATGMPVPGAPWWVVSKIDLAEVDAPAWRVALWTLAGAAFAVLGTGLAARLWAQRQAFAGLARIRNAERERLQTLGMLEAIAASASDAIFAKDLDGRYMFYNQAAAAALGKTPRDILGRTDVEVFGAQVAAELVARDREALAAGRPRQFEEDIPGIDGLKLVRCTKGPLFDADGRLIGLFGVSHDVTEAREAERALRDSEAHYRTVVSILNEGIMVCDAQGRVLSCNPAAERITGSRERDWRGHSVLAPGWSLLQGDGTPMLPHETPPGRVLAGEPAQLAVLSQTLDPAGRPNWFEISALPVLSTDTGELLAVVTSFADVTHRRRLEEELLAHRERLEEMVGERTSALQRANASLASAARFNRALTDAIPGRVAYWDADHRCRFANRSYAEWFGRTPEQMIGVTAEELVGAAHVEGLRPQIEGALQGIAQRFERERPEPDGSLAMHQIHWVPEFASPQGKVPGAYVMAFDITAIKRAQSELSAAKDDIERSRDIAEAANRAKSVFLANMSHEIRTPMNAIIGLTHLMSRATRDTLQRERLGKVADAAQHLLQVINDVLDISKIEAGKTVLEKAEFALEPLLARCLQMVGDRARDKGLELMLDTAGLPARLQGDPTRLSQALINLLSNAVKFTDRGWVRLRVEGRQRNERSQVIRFEVQDTGSGIPTERQARLFTAFEQVDGSATRAHGGTGLGLALTRQLATLMGGDTGVQSRPGSGSTFWFTAELGLASEAGEHAVSIPTHGLRCLLVDRSAESSDALAARLRAMGAQVHVEPDAAAARLWAETEFAHARPCDLVFIDSRSGAPDGSDTVDRLRETLGTGMPPCVLVTDAVEVPGHACDALIGTPFSPSALHDTMMRAVRQQGDALAAPAAPGESEALLRLRHAGQRVLLAEDNPVNRDVASELLRSTGLLIETAENGARAVELAASRHYDLILMDMQMPVMDGLAATRQIRDRAGRGIPVVALTANAFVDDRAACFEAGMNDHICKPVDPEVLYATLLRWLPLVERTPEPAPKPVPAAPVRGPGRQLPLQERLAGVQGFELNTALRNVGGRMATVERVLGRFADSYRGGVPEFDRAGCAADRQAMRQACHSLRGACAAIGATRIETDLRAFERLLQASGDDTPLGVPASKLQLSLATLVTTLETELQR